MSTTVELTAAPEELSVVIPESKSETPVWSSVINSPAFWPGVALAVGFGLLYHRLFGSLWELWMSEDGYFSHGFLVPMICGYVVYRAWPRIKDTPVKPALIAIVPLLALSWVGFRASSVGINMIMSACFIGSMMMAAAFVAGWRWMLALAPATLYSAFGMPFWNSAIDAYTNPLQKLSTVVAFQFLKISGRNPFMSTTDDTAIFLNNFVLNVAVPCSGLKLVLALTAFVAFFVLIARLKWWANAALVLSILPLALFFNGLRIALIGMVGDSYGEAAGMQFHDYSGYITLVLCFFALFKFTRTLGWNE